MKNVHPVVWVVSVITTYHKESPDNIYFFSMARKDHKIYFESLLVSINDEKIFDSCLDFYQFLGFEILKTESQSQIYKRRATLNLYSDTLISSFHSGLSITLELSDTKSYPFKAIFHADIKKLEKTLSNVVFSCENDQIIVNDPAGNSLCFSSLKGMELNDEPQFKSQLDSIEKQLFFSTSPSSAQFNCEKKKIAILTSGGDSSGMNAWYCFIISSNIVFVPLFV